MDLKSSFERRSQATMRFRIVSFCFFPNLMQLHNLGGTVFIGEGLARTYSVSCSGDFAPVLSGVLSHESPSGSTTHTASATSSQSPSLSSSNTISVTPIQSPSNSNGPSPSSSYSSSQSPPSSPSPTQFSTASECANGVSFWCATRENMGMCNVTVEMCQILMEALHPVLPSTLPSGTPAPSSTPSFSPTLTPGLVPARPTPTPSSSLIPPPYEEFSSPDKVEQQEGAGLSPCHYCNGGSDWTGGQCATGREQSPVTVNFESVDVDDAMDLYVASNYNQSWATLAWNGYAYTISSPTLGLVNIDAVNYHADLAVIRAPSEHKIAGVK